MLIFQCVGISKWWLLLPSSISWNFLTIALMIDSIKIICKKLNHIYIIGNINFNIIFSNSISVN